MLLGDEGAGAGPIMPCVRGEGFTKSRLGPLQVVKQSSIK